MLDNDRLSRLDPGQRGWGDVERERTNKSSTRVGKGGPSKGEKFVKSEPGRSRKDSGEEPICLCSRAQ